MNEQFMKIAVLRYNDLAGPEDALAMTETAQQLGATVIASTGVMDPWAANDVEEQQRLGEFHEAMLGLAWNGLSRRLRDRYHQYTALYDQEGAITNQVSSPQVRSWALYMRLGERAIYLTPNRNPRGEITKADVDKLLHLEHSSLWFVHDEQGQRTIEIHQLAREVLFIHGMSSDLQAGQENVELGEQPVWRPITDDARHRYLSARFTPVFPRDFDPSRHFAPPVVYTNFQAGIVVPSMPQSDGLQATPVAVLAVKR